MLKRKAVSDIARYIDADKFIERLKASPAFPNMGMDGYFLLDVVENLLKNSPTADVAPKSEVEFWQDAAANARREILLEIERLALSKIPEDVEVTMLKDTYYIEALDELMIKHDVTDKDVGCKKEEKE